jgi:catechol 2,3-dioxygenase-like lactoylglutathione lyase family enzyme
MKVKLSSVIVDDQEKALRFYTGVLGFEKKNDIPMGGARWLTVVSPEAPDEVELLLEPGGNAAARAYQSALFAQGVPLTAFAVDDLRSEYDRMKKLGVAFRGEPQQLGPTAVAVFEDTCGNLIQLYQVK